MTAQALKKDSLFDYIKFKTYFIPNHSSKQNLRRGEGRIQFLNQVFKYVFNIVNLELIS